MAVSGITLYPHTEQLPLLLRALNLEFYGALPDREGALGPSLATGFHKLVLPYYAAMMFCQHLQPHPRRPVAAVRPAGCQPRQQGGHRPANHRGSAARGGCHRFRFYAGKDFFPEILLSGRRLVFADHVIQRFCARVPNHIGEDLSNFLEIFYGHALDLSCRAVTACAFVVPLLQVHSGVPLPRRKRPGEYFVATCLTPNEMSRLEPETPACAHNFHYLPEYVPPARRHWLPTRRMLEMYECWEKKAPLIQRQEREDPFKWDRKFGLMLREATIKQGLRPSAAHCAPRQGKSDCRAGTKPVLSRQWKVYCEVA